MDITKLVTDFFGGRNAINRSEAERLVKEAVIEAREELKKQYLYHLNETILEQ
jgi:hypothetical protein